MGSVKYEFLHVKGERNTTGFFPRYKNIKIKMLRCFATARRPLEKPTFRGLASFTGAFPSETLQHLAAGGPNVFAAFTMFANEHDAVNLGQGFPTFGTPDFVKEAAARAVSEDHNQYSRPGGHPRLNGVLADFYAPRFKKKLDPLCNVTVFNGAQGALFNIILSFCDAGDEIAVIEPFFDAYHKGAMLVGAKTKGVPLRLPSGGSSSAADFKLDLGELDEVLNERTRLLILNTPHNPTGKVFSVDELQAISDVVRRYPDLIVVSDEVYEMSAFGGVDQHHRFAQCCGDDMFERTISLYSAGKTFSCTGWRIGYAIAPENLSAPLIASQGAINFCSPSPLEVAVSMSMHAAQENNYFAELAKRLEGKQRRFAALLEAAGMRPVLADGGYFLLAETSGIVLPEEEQPSSKARDWRVAEYLTEHLGVTGIPTSPFYISKGNASLAENTIRLCFARRDSELDEAGKRLAGLRHL